MYALNWPSHLRSSLLCSILSNSSGPRSNFSCSIWCFFSLSIRAFNSSVRDDPKTFIRSTLNYIICKYQFLISFPSFCVRGTRTQPLIYVGCAVHHWVSCAINKGFFWDCIFVVVVVDTHLPRFEVLAYVLPHFDALTHVVILVSSAFIFQRFAEVWYSVFVKRSSFKKFAESS